jgi:hypothetical protein
MPSYVGQSERRNVGSSRNPLASHPCKQRLSIARLINRAAIEWVLHDPWIKPKITRDGREPGFIDHPLLSYFGAYVDGKLLGLFIHIQFTEIEVEVHVALLKEALPHSRKLAALFIDLVFADPKVERATAHAIGSLKSAVNFGKKLGFTFEGERRNACYQNNRLLPVISLGLLRNEWLERRRRLFPLSRTS